ncbi:hypothetical protein LTR66_013938 [Elasticomyces elasticus]|nr:hypothetical protein LTR66_013938 [Elasticomyces elasticus]
MTTPTTDPPLIDTTTILSLLSTLAILLTAYATSLRLLPASAPPKIRALFIWHAFDALIHFLLEGSFLYNCFFASTPISTSTSIGPSPHLPPNVHFLARPGRRYGAEFGRGPSAALWREYARADARWAGTDLTVVSLELLTVFVAGPVAVGVCEGLRRGGEGVWVWIVGLAVGELYGGFMTFMPEWLSGSPNLNTSNFMYTWVLPGIALQGARKLTASSWVYLFFFNTLWVWIPLWILYEAYGHITTALNEQKARRSAEKNA